MTDRARDWMDKVNGRECPFDLPRVKLPANLIEIGRLSASTLYLERNQTYRGYCIAVYDKRHVTRIDELTPQEWLELAGDLHQAQSAIVKICSPAHVNVASLGNVVPHLHWHLIPRYLDDPRWGNPVWLSNLSDMSSLTLPPEDYEALIDQFRAVLL